MSSRSTLSIEERSAILDREIAKYIKRGFRVIARTDITAQLIKPKKFSFLWAILWFLLLGVGILVYLIYYWSKRDETIYLQINPYGRIKRTK